MPMTSRELDYELTRDDLFAFQWYATHKSRTALRLQKRTRVLYIIVGVVLTLLMAPWRHWILLVGFIIATVVYVVISRALIRFMTRRAIDDLLNDEAPNKGLLGRHHLRIDEFGVTESTTVGESRVAWPGVDRIERIDHALLLYITPTAAHVIPRRVFSTPDDEESFFQLVKSYLSNREAPVSS